MNIPHIPDQFMKLVALMESTTFPAERETARRKAEALLTPEMGGFERALRIAAYQQVRAANPNNIFAGFDEFQEIDSPGFMAREAEKRGEKLRQQNARRAELVAEFGSLDAVLLPCWREKALLAAVKPWRVAQPGSRDRWTKTLAGLGHNDDRKAPPELVAAIAGAFPMPCTYAEAVAEMAYWDRRNDDMELAARADFRGDDMLDTPCAWRYRLVRSLAEHRMELRTVGEIAARMRASRYNETGTDPDVEDALLRDLDALAAREAGAPAPEVRRSPASSSERQAESPASIIPATSSVISNPAPSKAKRQPSPWPTWAKLSHQDRLYWLQEVDAYHEIMGKSTKVAFYALHQKLFRRPHEMVTSDEVALFNRTVKAVWQRLQDLEKAA